MDNSNSLVQTVAISVISSAWYHKRALSLIRGQSSSLNFEELWRNRENQVLHDLKNLCVPFTVKQIFFDFYQPMGREIRTWMEDHNFLNLSEKTISEVLCWNALGVINTKRTTEKILANATADKSFFRLACMYSCKDVIITMWPEVMESYDIRAPLDSNTDRHVLFWVCYLQQCVGNLMKVLDYIGYKDTRRFGFWLATGTNNKMAAEFFLAAMPIEEIQSVVDTTAKRLCATGNTYNHYMLPVLMSHLDYHRQEELLRNHPQPILLQFLKWPNLHCFMEIINKTWSYLPGRTYYRILDDIAHFMDTFDKSEVYRRIFKEFWHNAPLHCCEYVRNVCVDGTFLTRLSLLTNSKYIMLTIIQSLTLEQKQRLITTYNGIQLIACLMRKQRWEMIQFIFEESKPLEGRAIWVDNLTETFSNAFAHNCIFINIQDHEQDRFFRILNTFKDM